MTFTIPADNVSAGQSGHIAWSNHISDAVTAAVRINVQNTAYAGGATGNGTTDDTAAIQAALNSVPTQGAFVFFPAGTYKITGSGLTIPSNVLRITGEANAGHGAQATTGYGAALVNASGPVFSDGFTNAHQGIEIDHLQIMATGGHCVSGINMTGNSHIHHIRFIQNSNGFSIWDHNGTAGGGAVPQYNFNNHFSDIECQVFGATRTVPAFNFYNLPNAYMTGVVFERITFNNLGNDASQYLMAISTGTGVNGGSYDNTIRECEFSQAYGGCIQLMGAQGCRIHDVDIDNYLITQALTNSAIFVGTPSGSRRSSNILISGLNVSTPPSAAYGPGSTYWNIQLDGTVDNVTILNAGVSAKLPSDGGLATSKVYVNLGSTSTNCVIAGTQSAYEIDNPNTDTLVIGSGDVQLDGTSAYTQVQQPTVSGMLAWTFDPASSSGSAANTTTGTIYAARIDTYKTLTVGHLCLDSFVIGTTPTTGENWIGLYNAAGTQLAQGSVDSLVTSSGLGKFAITAQTIAPGTYYVMWLMNAAAMPTLMKANGNVTQYNIGNSGATLRAAVYGTAQTNLPGTATMASLSATNATPYWVGLAT